MAETMVVGIMIAVMGAVITAVAATGVAVMDSRRVGAIAIPHLLRLAMESCAPPVALLMHQERNFVTNAVPH